MILIRVFFRMPEVELDSFQGLGIIPLDILQQGSRKIVTYVLDLFRSPFTEPLYRSKLMVVGFESVGKTTILDCLFPLEGWLQSQGQFLKTKYWFKLQGNRLSKYKNPSDPEPHRNKVVVLENRQWELISLPKNYGIRLTPKWNRGEEKEIEFYCPDMETHDLWSTRLRRICMNEATHGIEIQSMVVENHIIRDYFQEKSVNKGRLELSVWDFAGQHDYYNNHHYFLSARTVFLVLWKTSDGDEKGMRGLEFWFRSLATRLGVASSSASPRGSELALSPTSGTYYSIIVVGTFLDHPSVKKEEKPIRQKKIEEIAKESGLGSSSSSSLQYYEVSCSSLENIETVYEAIVRTALSHSYMGERVPKSYLQIQQYLTRLRREKLKIPLISIVQVNEEIDNLDLVKRALGLLSLWGECVYFESPPSLSSVVILDPRFLAKGILADLFTSDSTIRRMRQDGIVKHADLGHVWRRFTIGVFAGSFLDFAPIFTLLLQKLGVWFVIKEDENKPFLEQRSIIPMLLPEKNADPFRGEAGYPSHFQRVWPDDPPPNKPIQIERVLKFCRVVPSELVSRLLVHLHPQIQDGLVWKNEVVVLVMEMGNSQGWVRAEIEKARLVIVIRGSDVVDCVRLLEFILGRVREMTIESSPSPGEREGANEMIWEEKIRSPYFSGVEIDLSEAMREVNAGESERQLVCPETLLPVRGEQILVRAGLSLPSFMLSASTTTWWNFSSLAPAGKKGTLLMDVYERSSNTPEGGGVRNAELFAKFKTLFGFIRDGMSLPMPSIATTSFPEDMILEGIEKVYAINNPQLRSAFEIKSEVIEKQHLYNPGLFKKEGWRSLDDARRRKGMYLHLSSKIRAFRKEFNNGSHPFVVPMVHGTSENAAFRVMENGFGTVAGLDDGYYGRGMYFTSDLRYADMYGREIDPKGQPGVKVFFVAMVLPGNPYPVTEHPLAIPIVRDDSIEGDDKRTRNPLGYYGKALKAGYQSHYTVVDSVSISTAFPTQLDDFDDVKKGRVVSDELVVFEGAQALPLFLVYYKAPSPSSTSGVGPVRQVMFSQLSPSSSTQPQGEIFLVGVLVFLNSFALIVE